MKPLAPLNAPYPPPRKLTNWAEVLEETTENVWWGANVVDQLLWMRDNQTVWFYKNARCNMLPLIRHFIVLQNDNPYCTLNPISPNDKERLRPDVAKMLRAVQLFDWQDRIDFSTTNYNSYWWDGRTRLGRKKFQEFDWDEQDVQQYMNIKTKKQTW
jgi:hypothetical protein